MEKPCVVFISCAETPAKDVIAGFLGSDVLEEGVKNESGSLEFYPWTLDTKYYTVDLSLCAVLSKSMDMLKLVETAQGVVLYFDVRSDTSLSRVNEWLPVIDHIQPEVKLLLSSTKADNTSDTFKNAEQWCNDTGFELVEIINDSELEEDDDGSCHGFKRVKQALSAHVWPNLVMKKRNEPTSMSDLLNGGNLSSMPDEALLSAGLAEDFDLNGVLEDEVGDDFAELFCRLASMKERAASMPSEERKNFAEKVVYAYWKALGGDEEDL